jgi:hypothetical protein
MSRRRIFLLALNAFALVALFYGPLFAWSPVTPGFARSQHGNLTYLHRVDRPLTPQHRAVAQELPRLEATFGLSFNGAVTIVLCDAPGDFHRFTPWLPNPPGVGARTLQFGTVVYVAPTVRDRQDVGDFIRHELIHVLLLRNTSLFSRVALSRHWWLLEGLSVEHGNRGSYLHPDAHRASVLAAELPAILDPDSRANLARASLTERYAVAGAFVRRLIERKGWERWPGFLREYVADPGPWRDTFARHFGESFEAAIGEFRTHLTRTTVIQVPFRQLRP